MPQKVRRFDVGETRERFRNRNPTFLADVNSRQWFLSQKCFPARWAVEVSKKLGKVSCGETAESVVKLAPATLFEQRLQASLTL